MKRTNYGGAGRPAPVVPTKPKAPLPFNLPSLKSAAGRAEKGAVGGAAAGWAARGANGGAEAGNDANDAAATNVAPPAPAWGGAGVRGRAGHGGNATGDQPQVQMQQAQRAPARVRPQPRLDARQDVRRERADAGPTAPPAVAAAVVAEPEKPVKVPDAPPPVPTPTQPATVETVGVPDDDWAEDDGGELTFSSLALPEVSIEAGPPPAPAAAPAQAGHPRGARRIAPAAHWQIGAPNHPLGPGRRPPAGQTKAEPKWAPDLRAVEEQKDVMKMNAESAREARRQAEEDRLRAQRERSNQKLRELEMRMGLKDKGQPKGGAGQSKGGKGKGASAKADRGEKQPASAWGARTAPKEAATPKVVLRRPAKKDPPATAAVPEGAHESARESGRSRRRNGGRSERSEQSDGGRRPSRDNGRLYDGPRGNESREQWLERRRAETEGRDVVKSIIDSCINRAVYGRKPRKRGGERGGRGRRKDAKGEQKGDGSSKSDGASKGEPPKLALPAVGETAAAQPAAAWEGRGRARATRTLPPAAGPAGRAAAPQPARPAPWAPGVKPRGGGGPLASPGTATVTSVVDAAIGDADASSGSTPSLPGKPPRRKGGRKRGGKGGEKRERGREGPAAAPKPPVAPVTTAVQPDEAAWASGLPPPQPTSFDAISRAFSNTAAGLSPFVHPVAVVPARSWPAATAAGAAAGVAPGETAKWWPPAPVGPANANAGAVGTKAPGKQNAPTPQAACAQGAPNLTEERPKRGRKRGGQGRRRQPADAAAGASGDGNVPAAGSADKPASSGGGRAERGRRGRGRRQRDGDRPNGGQNGGQANGAPAGEQNAAQPQAEGAPGQAGQTGKKSSARRGRSGRGRRGGRGGRGANRAGDGAPKATQDAQ